MRTRSRILEISEHRNTMGLDDFLYRVYVYVYCKGLILENIIGVEKFVGLRNSYICTCDFAVDSMILHEWITCSHSRES